MNLQVLSQNSVDRANKLKYIHLNFIKCNFYIIFCLDIYVDKKKMGYNRKCSKEAYTRTIGASSKFISNAHQEYMYFNSLHEFAN